MEYLLNLLTTYSNLILVIITGVYAYLTWRMVKEMKIARENQIDSNVIAFPTTMGQIHALVHLENAGPGIALDVELSISLDPPHQKATNIWKHPALPVGQKELFLFPYETGSSGIESLKQLSEKHEKIVITIKWNNVFGHSKAFHSTYGLSDLIQGWYSAGRIIKPKDLPKQMEDISKSLGEIQSELAKFNRNINPPNYVEIMDKSKTKTPRKKKVTK